MFLKGSCEEIKQDLKFPVFVLRISLNRTAWTIEASYSDDWGLELAIFLQLLSHTFRWKRLIYGLSAGLSEVVIHSFYPVTVWFHTYSDRLRCFEASRSLCRTEEGKQIIVAKQVHVRRFWRTSPLCLSALIWEDNPSQWWTNSGLLWWEQIHLHSAGLWAQVPLEDLWPICVRNMQMSSPLKVILWDSGSAPSIPLCTVEQINEALLRPGPGFLTYFPGLSTYVPSWRCWTTWAAWLDCKCCFMLPVMTRTQKQSGENNCSQTFTVDGCVGFVSLLHLLFSCIMQVRLTKKQWLVLPRWTDPWRSLGVMLWWLNVPSVFLALYSVSSKTFWSMFFKPLNSYFYRNCQLICCHVVSVPSHVWFCCSEP